MPLRPLHVFGGHTEVLPYTGFRGKSELIALIGRRCGLDGSARLHSFFTLSTVLDFDFLLLAL